MDQLIFPMEISRKIERFLNQLFYTALNEKKQFTEIPSVMSKQCNVCVNTKFKTLIETEKAQKFDSLKQSNSLTSKGLTSDQNEHK